MLVLENDVSNIKSALMEIKWESLVVEWCNIVVEYLVTDY